MSKYITHDTYKELTPEEQEKYGEATHHMVSMRPETIHYLKPVEAQQSEAEGFDSPYQDLFTHMQRDHNLILLESEMSDIIEAAKPLWQGEITALQQEVDRLKQMNFGLVYNAECRLEENVKLQQEVERLKEALRWVPVTERLPEDGRPVLTTWHFKVFDVGILDNLTNGDFLIQGGTRRLYTSHWQPLPPPPTN